MSPLKIVTIALIAIIIVYVGYEAIRINHLLSETNELIAGSKPYSQSPAGATTTILFLGDSTVVGTGSTNPDGSANPSQSIAGRFGTLFPNAKIINDGVNGEKIRELVQSIQKNDPITSQNGGKKVDLLVIQIGGNDILKLTNFDSVKTDLATLLQLANTMSNKVVILHSGNVGLSPFFPRIVSFIWTDRSAEFRTLYMQDAAQYGATYVDLFSTRSDDLFLTDPQKYYAADYVHPSGAGYEYWFDKIVAALKVKYGQNFL